MRSEVLIPRSKRERKASEPRSALFRQGEIAEGSPFIFFAQNLKAMLLKHLGGTVRDLIRIK